MLKEATSSKSFPFCGNCGWQVFDHWDLGELQIFSKQKLQFTALTSFKNIMRVPKRALDADHFSLSPWFPRSSTQVQNYHISSLQVEHKTNTSAATLNFVHAGVFVWDSVCYSFQVTLLFGILYHPIVGLLGYSLQSYINRVELLQILQCSPCLNEITRFIAVESWQVVVHQLETMDNCTKV